MDPEVSLMLQCPPGGLPEQQVRAELSPAHDRRPLPGGDQAIAAVWESRLQAQPWLFDAPKFRLHSAALEPTGSQGPQLLLRLGLTSYRDFLGTNWASSAAWLRQQGLADWGDKQAYLADPLGVGAALTTADDFLVFLRRSQRVAEAPGLVDVPGGHPEPQGQQAQGKAGREEVGSGLSLSSHRPCAPVTALCTRTSLGSWWCMNSSPVSSRRSVTRFVGKKSNWKSIYRLSLHDSEQIIQSLVLVFPSVK
ncbi:uridine diphosphate glucose pyrophosphatase NUDT22 isoform X3 [Phyllostomus discolor]|uniref:Uridine diphosphate glucose pyrophosphatase NUDT22 isoform X3 n=1 Tax=Phyllostomus discolor TaxID=89673 RepID=A0A7E6E398_9CHIR|nr:uridine diphosphate glucose pyrophosphatase NUDT22 isoform X3 [Phyllostomus discolor]